MPTTLNETLTLELCRPVEEHARLVMKWRNDPQTLAMSYHRDPKVWESFWPEFRDVYFRFPNLPPLFALVGGHRAGFIRFVPQVSCGERQRRVEVSINLAPEFRGQGLGAILLQRAVKYLGESTSMDVVIAEVRQENEASHKAFLKAGFRKEAETVHVVPETEEKCSIVRYGYPLTPTFWSESRVMVIAEAGSNWRAGSRPRDMAMAKALIDVAADAGADAVKFQTYRPETVYVANAGESDYLADHGIKEDIGTIFADLAMPYEMLEELAGYCKERAIAFMSTGFSPADFAAIDPFVSIHKIASYEISHVHLLKLAAKSGKPLILSTGASTEADIDWAVKTFREAGGRDLCLMQCTAKYPAPISSLNLGVLPWLQCRFGVATGLSDHSREPALAPVVAVAQGARVIEKHYTLDNRLPGPDHAFALLPHELKEMVRQVRMAEESLGSGVKTVLADEAELASFARRGLQALCVIKPGEVLREGETFAVLRPGKRTLGIHPRYLQHVEGKHAIRAIAAGDGIQEGDWAE